jgi:hypothetical protein
MTTIRRHYTVDRMEGALAILLDDRGGRIERPRDSLPLRLKEGMVLLVPLDDLGELDWSAVTRDEAEERRRLEDAKARLERLRKRDPGGDVNL